MRAFWFWDAVTRDGLPVHRRLNTAVLESVHWLTIMKSILPLFVLAISLGAVRAQEAASEPVPATDYQAPAEAYAEPVAVATPAVVYDAPVVYNAPVAYQAPVVYNAPVYYAAPVAVASPVVSCPPPAPCYYRPARSTVVYIGGGHVSYQVAHCNSGSTVTFIGGGSRFH